MSDENEQIEGAEAEAAEQERPGWLPERFKTPEDLAASWENADRKISELGTKLSEMEAQYGEVTERLEQATSVQAQTQHATEDERIRAAMARAWEEGDVDAFSQLQDYRTSRIVEAAVGRVQAQTGVQTQQAADPAFQALTAVAEQHMRASYPDYDEVRPAMRSILDSYQLITDEQARTLPGIQSGLQAAYQLAKAPALLADQAQRDAENAANLRMKENAQTLTGAGGRPPSATEVQDEWAKIVAADTGVFRGFS